jgi:ankyrin repeat protein
MESLKWLKLCFRQERGGMVMVSKQVLRSSVDAELESGKHFGAPLHVAILMENTEMVELLIGNTPNDADCTCE